MNCKHVSNGTRKILKARKLIDKGSSAQQNFSRTIAHMLTIHALRFGSLFFQIRIPPTHMRGLSLNSVCKGTFACSFIWTGRKYFLSTFTNLQFYLGPGPM